MRDQTDNSTRDDGASESARREPSDPKDPKSGRVPESGKISESKDLIKFEADDDRQIKIGELDGRGRQILDILWHTDNFVIFKTSKGISVRFSKDDEEKTKQVNNYLEISQELSHMNHLVHLLNQGRRGRYFKKLFGKKDSYYDHNDYSVIYYERELANCIALSVTGHVDHAKMALMSLTGRLEKKLKNEGRVVYFSICFFISLFIVCLISITVADFGNIDFGKVGLAAVMGSVGALLSASAGLRRLHIDASASPFMNWIYGSQRMLIGMLGAVILYFAMNVEFVMDVISRSNADMDEPFLDEFEIAFASILAGFSERLVPNLLDRNGRGDQDSIAP